MSKQEGNLTFNQSSAIIQHTLIKHRLDQQSSLTICQIDFLGSESRKAKACCEASLGRGVIFKHLSSEAANGSRRGSVGFFSARVL